MLLSFLYVIYRVDLIGVDLLGFVEIHPDMAEDEISSLCKYSAMLFLIVS